MCGVVVRFGILLLFGHSSSELCFQEPDRAIYSAVLLTPASVLQSPA